MWIWSKFVNVFKQTIDKSQDIVRTTWDKSQDIYSVTIEKGKRLSNIRLLVVIIFIVVLFFVVNYIFFVSYLQLNETEVSNLKDQLKITENETAQLVIKKDIALKENGWVLLWNYCSTETFKTISISILITIFGAALGYLFKVDEAIKERLRAQRQKRIQAQTACIESTTDMWHHFDSIVSEIRFYEFDSKRVGLINNTQNDAQKDESDKESGSAETKKTIVDLLKEIEYFVNKAEVVFNKWRFSFPELPKILNRYIDIGRYKKYKNMIDLRASSLILIFINLLYEASSSAGYHIWKFEQEITNEKDLEKKKNIIANNQQRIQTIQSSLSVIQDLVRFIIHQPMIGILKCATEPLEGWGASREEDIEARSYIISSWQELFENAIKIKRIELKIRPDAQYTVCDWEVPYTCDHINQLAEEFCAIANEISQQENDTWRKLIKIYEEKTDSSG